MEHRNQIEPTYFTNIMSGNTERRRTARHTKASAFHSWNNSFPSNNAPSLPVFIGLSEREDGGASREANRKLSTSRYPLGSSS